MAPASEMACRAGPAKDEKSLFNALKKRFKTDTYPADSLVGTLADQAPGQYFLKLPGLCANFSERTFLSCTKACSATLPGSACFFMEKRFSSTCNKRFCSTQSQLIEADSSCPSVFPVPIVPARPPATQFVALCWSNGIFCTQDMVLLPVRDKTKD